MRLTPRSVANSTLEAVLTRAESEFGLLRARVLYAELSSMRGGDGRHASMADCNVGGGVPSPFDRTAVLEVTLRASEPPHVHVGPDSFAADELSAAAYRVADGRGLCDAR